METQPDKIIFHPVAGLRIVRNLLFQLKLGSCNRPESFILSSHGILSRTEEHFFFFLKFMREESLCVCLPQNLTVQKGKLCLNQRGSPRDLSVRKNGESV